MRGAGLPRYRFGDQGWQSELWRLYDIVGEFRFLASWVGSMCARTRMYIADVDANGRIQGETDDARIAAIGDEMLGGSISRPEAQRLVGVNATVAGECYLVVRDADDGDGTQWAVVSSSELRRHGGYFLLGPEGERVRLDAASTLVIRSWTPHPRYGLYADCPARAALPILLELERLTRYVAAQLDSRLVSAGLLAIPNDLSFPSSDGTPADDLMTLLVEAGQVSLRGEGTAAGVLPTVIDGPPESISKIQMIDIAGSLSTQAQSLREEAIRRLALAMDAPPEVLTGTGDTNHWSGFLIEQGGIKTHIEPVMMRLADTLTTSWLRPLLQTQKIDPRRYCVWFDTSELTVRPDRLKDTLALYEKGVVSARAVLLSGAYPLSSAPDERESAEKFIRELLLRDPSQFANPVIREAAGISENIIGADAIAAPAPAPGAGPPPPPPPRTAITPATATPQESTNPAAPVAANTSGTNQAARTASSRVPIGPMALAVLAHTTVLRAMELAGKKLLTRDQRGRWESVAAHDLHTRIRVRDEGHAVTLLAGAWDRLGTLATDLDITVDSPLLAATLQEYCVTLLVRGLSHDVDLLGETLRRRGFFDVP